MTGDWYSVLTPVHDAPIVTELHRIHRYLQFFKTLDICNIRRIREPITEMWIIARWAAVENSFTRGMRVQ